MEENKEVQEPQKTPEEAAPQAEIASMVITEEEGEKAKKELEDLKHKAEVSSQNFERAKKAEARVKELEELQESTDQSSFETPDTGVGELASELNEVKAKLAKTEVIEQYPQLKEVWTEFDSFRAEDENKGLNLKTAAKAFMIEKELLDPKRKGLEKSSGGDKGPTSTGMSAEDLKNLRENDYDKYRDMLKKGQIKFS